MTKELIFKLLAKEKNLNSRIKARILATADVNKANSLANSLIKSKEKLMAMKKLCDERKIKFDITEELSNIDSLDKLKIAKIKAKLHEWQEKKHRKKKKPKKEKDRINTPEKNRKRLARGKNSRPAIFTENSVRTVSGGLPETSR